MRKTLYGALLLPWRLLCAFAMRSFLCVQQRASVAARRRHRRMHRRTLSIFLAARPLAKSTKLTLTLSPCMHKRGART